jgi:hypothetical protein
MYFNSCLCLNVRPQFLKLHNICSSCGVIVAVAVAVAVAGVEALGLDDGLSKAEEGPFNEAPEPLSTLLLAGEERFSSKGYGNLVFLSGSNVGCNTVGGAIVIGRSTR